ncbi:unnamed protein product, partial [Amoebophrya sp. A25]|eukprot:GSA25T00012936001.1
MEHRQHEKALLVATAAGSVGAQALGGAAGGAAGKLVEMAGEGGRPRTVPQKGRRRGKHDRRTNDGTYHDDPYTLEHLAHLIGGEYLAIATEEEASEDPYWNWKPKLLFRGPNYKMRQRAQRHLLRIRKINMEAALINAEKTRMEKEAKLLQ